MTPESKGISKLNTQCRSTFILCTLALKPVNVYLSIDSYIHLNTERKRDTDPNHSTNTRTSAWLCILPQDEYSTLLLFFFLFSSSFSLSPLSLSAVLICSSLFVLHLHATATTQHMYTAVVHTPLVIHCALFILFTLMHECRLESSVSDTKAGTSIHTHSHSTTIKDDAINNDTG